MQKLLHNKIKQQLNCINEGSMLVRFKILEGNCYGIYWTTSTRKSEKKFLQTFSRVFLRSILSFFRSRIPNETRYSQRCSQYIILNRGFIINKQQNSRKRTISSDKVHVFCCCCCCNTLFVYCRLVTEDLLIWYC